MRHTQRGARYVRIGNIYLRHIGALQRRRWLVLTSSFLFYPKSPMFKQGRGLVGDLHGT